MSGGRSDRRPSGRSPIRQRLPRLALLAAALGALGAALCAGG